MKKRLYLLSTSLVMCLSLIGNVSSIVTAETTTYTLGNSTTQSQRLEAENYNTNSLTTNTVSPYKSGTSVVELSLANDSVEFTVNMATAGNYYLKWAYQTSVSRTLDVTINDTTTTTSTEMLINGRQEAISTSNNFRMMFYHNHLVSLNAGSNTIKIINTTSGDIDIDFIEIYEENNLYYYPIEKQLLGMQWVGERIEAEYGLHQGDLITRYSNAFGKGTVANFSNGNAIGLGSNASNAATMKYIVNAEKAGTYDLQIASTCNSNVKDTNQIWTINGLEYTLTLNWIVGTGSNSYTCMQKFEIELKEGVNEITFTAYAKVSCNIDYFTILEKDENKLDTILQAENYADGIVRIKPINYPITDGFVTEFSNTREGYISVDLDVEEAGYYDLYVRGFTGSKEAQLKLIVNDETYNVDTEYNNNWLGSYPKIAIKDNYYSIYLNQGTNSVKMAYATNYFTMDWFHITKSKLVGNQGTDFILNRDETYPITKEDAMVANPNVAIIENGQLVAKNGGETYISYKTTLPNGYTFIRKHKVVVNSVLDETSQFVFEDQTLYYDGKAKQIYAEVPEGWTVTYYGYEKDLINPGTYKVVALFESSSYFIEVNGVQTNKVRKEATLTIAKGDYQGEDLILESKSFDYDGTNHSLEASCPEGWQVIYENNSKVYRGSVEVKAYFIHKGYNIVTKTATLTIN